MSNWLWNTSLMEDESLMMLRDASGCAKAPLLYKPERIMSVTNARKTETYEEGVDWVLEDGCIVLTENSRIFAFTEEELYPAQGEPGRSFAKPDGYVLFSEGSFFHDRQIAVTYTCRPGQWTGEVPGLADRELPRTMQLLRSGAPCHVLLYGDSISVGGNASGYINAPPYQPEFGRLLHQALVKRYGKQVRYTNTSEGGMGVNWAIEHVEERVNAHRPDLVILGWGMNDGAMAPEEFERQTRTLMDAIRKENPACEFILISTSLPNPLLTDARAPFWGNQQHFHPYLARIAQDTAGTAEANITGMHRSLLERKRFIDMNANHVNHPNDFLHRWHAEYLQAMLIDA